MSVCRHDRPHFTHNISGCAGRQANLNWSVRLCYKPGAICPLLAPSQSVVIPERESHLDFKNTDSWLPCCSRHGLLDPDVDLTLPDG